jgi:SAM-dependent methyltransferase
MSEDDRQHWDARYAEGGMAPPGDHGPPPGLTAAAHLIPTTGSALDVACGRGRTAVWLAQRGMDVFAVDVSPVAIDLARELAILSGVAERCRFEVFDLDQGLPESPRVDLVLCHLFRDPRLDQLMMDRLKPGGIVVIAVLSEVGVGPGPFRVRQGELVEAFDAIEILAADEVDGLAWLVGGRPG